MKRYFIALLVTTVQFCSPLVAFAAGSLVGSANTISNGLSKEAEPDSEVITYGNFKMGAYRDAYDIPSNYGQLVDVTSSRNGFVTLWFVDKEGNIRNVALDEVSPEKPFVIHRKSTFTLK